MTENELKIKAFDDIVEILDFDDEYESFEEYQLDDITDIVRSFQKRIEVNLQEVNFFEEVKKAECFENYEDCFNMDNPKGFILWNRTQNDIYEFSSDKNDLSMYGFMFEGEDGDKIYILDVEQNLLIDFQG